jgi:glycosyltransferase involved in cell wall biosynthesis
MNNTVLVSVVMITYKHEAYIKQAIEGVLMQETNFEYELIISDDCSPDLTKQVVDDIIANHKKGNKIKYFRHEKNVGMQNNSAFALLKCNAKYIAICEGDDYWIDPLKLQKQVDFLENNPNYSFCCHSYKIYNQEKNILLNEIHPSNLKIDEKLKGKIINKINFHDEWMTQPLTALIRHNELKTVLKESDKFKYFRDFHTYYLLLNYGNGICFNFIGGIYRQHAGGMHSGIDEHERLLKALSIYEELYVYSKDKFFLKMYSKISLVLMKKRMENFSFNKKILSKLMLKHKIYYLYSFFGSAYYLAKQKYINS